MKHKLLILVPLFLSGVMSLIINLRPVHAQTSIPVVHAVLFYSPICGHCHYVITEILPPLFEKYSSQLQVLMVDVTQPDGQTLFQTVLQKFNLESGGVPFLAIGNIYLIGSIDIPKQFPVLIEQYLAQGGVDWPAIPGLAVTRSTQESLATATPIATAVPIVHAVLFYRSQCRFCQQVVATVIPPLLDKYASQLDIFRIDVSQPDGDILFIAAIEHFSIKTIGTPTLIVGNDVLIGGIEIPQKLPGIIESHLSQGGIDWPDIPGLTQALAKAETTATPAVQPPAEFQPVFPAVTPIGNDLPLGSQSSSPFPIIRTIAGMGNNFSQDPLGNTVSVVILTGLIISAILGIRAFFKQPGASLSRQPVWVIPGLCAIGIGIASYLAYVEMTSAEAICGPVGHCQTVQQSAYARLFGIFPIGLLGVAGYVAILAAWLVGRSSSTKFAELASLALLGMTASGLLFSIYLTFLESFVIGATCVWCLSSAILIAVLMLLSIAPGKLAYNHMRQKI